MCKLYQLIIFSTDYKAKTHPIHEELKVTYNGAYLTISVENTNVLCKVTCPDGFFIVQNSQVSIGGLTWDEILDEMVKQSLYKMITTAALQKVKLQHDLGEQFYVH